MSETEIKNRVMEFIRGGQAQMKPRWRFILQATLVIASAVLAAVALIYLVSFIAFTLRAAGVLYVPFYRMAGITLVLRSMPWLLVALALVFIALLELLVRRYSFAYRRPLLYSAAAIILLAFLGGAAAERTNFHATFFRGARHGDLPVAGRFYRGFGERRMKDIHRGIVRNPGSSEFTLQTYVEGDVRVFMDLQTKPLWFPLKEGSPTVVIGPREGDFIRALEILFIGPTEAPEWR